MTAIGTVSVEERGATIVAQVAGELDLSNVEEIESMIAHSITRDTHGVVLDLSETTFLDSTGIRMIFGLAERLRARRYWFRVVADATTLVHRVLVLSRIYEALPVDASLADALAAASDS